MSALQIALLVVVGPPLAYLVVRFASAAYFNSKQYYEKEKYHEPR